ncbi:hypothetical protein AGMMS49545_22650 [Betaproteobacteria bacterium]|nr:hypothetical protein AGMMS49545_22650 [Betaproteobacteria bacterium]GHU48568.1 hypothetical protein AGMMS50289_25330 [Betaproteobacteria bacterium]
MQNTVSATEKKAALADTVFGYTVIFGFILFFFACAIFEINPPDVALWLVTWLIALPVILLIAVAMVMFVFALFISILR